MKRLVHEIFLRLSRYGSSVVVAGLALPLGCRNNAGSDSHATSALSPPVASIPSPATPATSTGAPSLAQTSPTAQPSAIPSPTATGALPTVAATAASEPTTALDPALLTAGIIEVKREGSVQRQVGIRTGRHTGYERVVFEFEQAVPGYHLEYIDKPVRACGSGDVVTLEGDGWLQVRFYAAQAHTDEGAPTIAERELAPKLDVIREVERTCDFEGVVTWVVGTASPNRYRVFELRDPPRLVLDIATR